MAKRRKKNLTLFVEPANQHLRPFDIPATGRFFADPSSGHWVYFESRWWIEHQQIATGGAWPPDLGHFPMPTPEEVQCLFGSVTPATS